MSVKKSQLINYYHGLRLSFTFSFETGRKKVQQMHAIRKEFLLSILQTIEFEEE